MNDRCCFVAHDGRVIDGPVPLRTVAANFATGLYPAGCQFCEDGQPWEPLTEAALSRPRPRPLIHEVPSPRAPRPATAPWPWGDILGAGLLMMGIIGILISLLMDVSAAGDLRLANFHAMHQQSLGIMISLTSILCGVMVLTRRR